MMARLNQFTDRLPLLIFVPFVLIGLGFMFGCILALFMAGMYLPMTMLAKLLGW